MSDLRFVQRVLNQRVLPWLQARGVPVAGGKFVFPKAVEQLSVADIVQLSGVMDIPQSYLHEKYSIPAPKDGEPVARRQPTPVPDDPGSSGDPDDDSAVANSDRSFFRRLRDFFVKAPQVGASNGSLPMRLADFSGDTLDERLMAAVSSGAAPVFSPELFDFISSDLLNAVRPAFRRRLNCADLSHAYGLRDDAFITALEMNLFHFSAGKTLAEIQELNRVFRESTSYADFQKRASEVCTTFNKIWQRTEYETAVLTAESASNYHRLKAQSNLFPYWRYVTAGDDRVRREHRLLDGVILPYNHELWDKIFPPNGWKCRCRVAAVMRHEAEGVDIMEMERRVHDYLGTPEWEMNRAQGWDVNRGKTAEIFSKNQQYIRKFPGKAAKRLLELYHYDYGLDSINKRIAASVTPSPVFAGDPARWFADHPFLEDYMGRRVSLRKKVFDFHTTGSHSGRVPLLDCVTEALRNPDEVWLNDYDKGTGDFTNLNFIKFYDGMAMNVICEVRDGEVYEVKTWFPIWTSPRKGASSKSARRDDPKWRYRRGLLIKKS